MADASTRRNDIVAVARRMFTTTGFDGTAIGDIAKEIGASKAAVYYYFPGKTDFLDELAEPMVKDLTDVLDRHVGATWPDGIRAMVTEYFGVLLDWADTARWVDTDPALRLAGRPGTTMRALDRRLALAIAEGSPENNDTLRAFAVVGGLWRPLHHETPESVREHLDEVVHAALVSYAPL